MKQLRYTNDQTLMESYMQEPFNPGELFRHTDGGYYRYLGHARHADDQAVHIVYEHVWPFETDGYPWLRRVEEWEGRFTAVSREELAQAMQKDKMAARAEVAAAKEKRRAAAARNAVAPETM